MDYLKIDDFDTLDEYLAYLDEVIKKEIIYLILEQLYGGEIDLVNNKHVDMIRHLSSSLRSNSYIYLPNK